MAQQGYMLNPPLVLWFNNNEFISFEEGLDLTEFSHFVFKTLNSSIILHTTVACPEMTKSLVCSDYQCKAENGSGYS